jgi:hypothetical protein
MARLRSVDFLPEVFKTDTNKEFLSSTLDQLVQQPKLKQTQGYVGRTFGPGIESADAYILEPNTVRANYQLEPGIVFKNDNNDVETAIPYIEHLDALSAKGANVAQHDRLFSEKIYSWSPLIDFDKFVNYSQYYWLPSGTDSVNVSASDVLLTNDFDVIRNETHITYSFGGVAGENPAITLVRGGNYTFNVSQVGNNFSIQTEPGADGTLNHSPNISSTDILGITNNAEDLGTITFKVPSTTSQQFFYDLPDIGSVDLATFKRFDSVNAKLVSHLGGIDGILDLEGKTVVFLNSTPGNSADLGWQYLDLHEDAPFEAEPFEETSYIDAQADRYSIYQIEFIGDITAPIIKLNLVQPVANLEKLTVAYGDVYSNILFYKNASGFFEKVPLLTALQDTLYYQDSTDENRFGIINLITTEDDPVLDISNILGKKIYTSPNGVKFTNGLKVKFRGNVVPASYQNNEYYVECVGLGIQLVSLTDLVTPEKHVNSDLVPFDLKPFDSSNFDQDSNSPTDLDFITISRASRDLNSWTRSNRWVHVEVINQTASLNNTIAILDNNFRANRPIIEFEKGLRLFNSGTESKLPVNVIDFSETDAFGANTPTLPTGALLPVAGATSFIVDGFHVVTGSRIVFANDIDPAVRNKIYEVQFIDPNNDDIDTISLVLATDGNVEVDQTVLCVNGLDLEGKMFYFDGITWLESQQKTAINQPPLFDVFDSNGLSLSNTTIYPSTSFVGTKLFSYGVGTGANDAILGFPLKFLNIDNLGDIVFDNNLYKDTFTHSNPSQVKSISDGFVRKYTARNAFGNEIGWTNFIETNIPPQVFNFEFDGVSLKLDVQPRAGLNVPAIKVFTEDEFICPDDYTVTTAVSSTVIQFTTTVAIGSSIQVIIISDDRSSVGYYKIPKNLENNVFNENSDQLTLGSIRNHYNNLSYNLLDLVGEVNGANNTRDLGAIDRYGDTIIQNSSPFAPMSKFLHSNEFNFFESLEFSSQSYERCKQKVLTYVNNIDTYGMSPDVVLNKALREINIGKGPLSAFYQSDMLPSGTPTTTTHVVTLITTDTFNIVDIHDFTKASQTAILVYLNEKILLKDADYTVSTDSATIQVLRTLTNGDVVEVREYSSTLESYVPSTPTKLGLYPKYKPKKYLDNSYVVPVNVIQGHDGSITVAFNDARDDILLEFESRIYNNIKVDSMVPLRESDVIPGRFRTTEYSDSEITNILSVSFLNWVGQHRLNYKTQDYRVDNEFTWNYSTAGNRLDRTALKGHWRGIYRNYYDTDTPNLTPWEMLGITEKPVWWDDEYGTAPYTSGNLVLWDDLEAGVIKEPGNKTTDLRYARPGLTSIIPVDSEGNLLNPFVSLVQGYSKTDFRKSWVIGDGAPVEATWRKSSTYPFAVQRLFALTKPAQFFALGIDRDRYAFDTALGQFLYDGRHRLDARTVEIQSDTTSKHSYINWIVDYNRNSGFSDGTQLTTELSRLDVRLCYKMASFTDKQYLKIFTDRSSPDSLNTGLLLPDQSFQLLLHKNQPTNELQYSSVIVQRTEDGYAVFGNSRSQQFFQILHSLQNNNFNELTIANKVVRLPKDFSDDVTLVPYGFVFTTTSSVVDFLASYGAFLETQGLVFQTREQSLLSSGETTAVDLNWGRMAQEFIQWVEQGWDVGSVIDLNPAATTLEFEKSLAVVDDITGLSATDQPLDQNGMPLTRADYTITRLDNNFKLTTNNRKSIDYMRIRATSFEHLLVLDNVSIFNDLLYQPVTGLRQQRIRLVGFTTFEWNGQLDAQGFILNQDNVKEWKPNKTYTIGNIVKFKNIFWSATTKIEPAEEFNFNNWYRIDHSKISTGLLPNLSNKASQVSQYYNNKTANLESDVDLLALGLIGFRPRTHFNALDDTSQVNFYTEFIRNKGTRNSIDAFSNVDFDKKITNYQVFENWAVQQATYGSSSNKSFVDLELSDTVTQNNPAVVELVSPASTKVADYQLIKTNKIFKESEPHLDSNIFPMLLDNSTGTNLPIAGNVHLDDVDISVFELSDLANVVNQVQRSSLIWVAKDNTYNWNVYRAEHRRVFKTLTLVDNVIQATFYDPHTFTVGDKVVIQDAVTEVNGAHVVLSIINNTTISIDGTLDDTFSNTATNTTGTADTDLFTADNTLSAVVYKLNSMRVDTLAELELEFFRQLPVSSKAWVRDVGGKYAVYQKFNVVHNESASSTLVTADLNDSATLKADSGEFTVVDNNKSASSTLVTADSIETVDHTGVWIQTRIEESAVDVTLVNRVIIYSKDTNQTKEYLDYIDPINGKVLGVAQENIDYIGANDPASYNQGLDNITSVLWGKDKVGQIWWDTTNARYLDYRQKEVTYSSRNWGTLFPGSSVNINQWIKSSVHPLQYTGPGTVVDVDSFTAVSNINSSNTIVQTYYFWVTGLLTVNRDAGKTLSTATIQQYITDPKGSGIPFVGFLQQNVIALFNVQGHLTNGDAVLHVSYNNTESENSIFSEYNLIKENSGSDFLGAQEYRKLQDSFVGGNTLGFTVPDPNLSVANRLGISFRPRQSMFDNRLNALKEYLIQVNALLKQHVISTSRDFTMLNNEELIPTVSSGEWDFQVADLAELGFQDLSVAQLGFKYLVDVDTNNSGGWSIYEVIAGPALQLVRVQQFDTTRAWDFINWYESDAIANVIPSIVVDSLSDLSSLTEDESTFAKVSINSAGKFEIYQLRSNEWKRVGLEDGTIAFKSSLYSGESTQDNITVDTGVFLSDSIVLTAGIGVGGTELRNVIRAINEDLLIDDLLINRNILMTSVFNFILSEQGSVGWLYKTSLVDVEHKVRDLVKYATYKRDDQDFVLRYLEESKPYHVKIKEFLLKYDGLESADADVTDFDVPSQFDTTFSKFISPILDYDGAILTSDQSNFDENGVGFRVTNPNIWTTNPWSNWFDNRFLVVDSVNLVNSGTGYTTEPAITVVGGGATTQATMTARISTSGEVISITVNTPGVGYLSTPTITVVGGGGSGAVITPILRNNLVRSLKTTIKYDRYEYDFNVIDWAPLGDVFHYSTQLLRQNNKVYKAIEERKVDSTMLTVDHDANSRTSDTLQTAGSFDIGFIYEIISIGTTDFTLIGAPLNDIGDQFRATGLGTGTGTALKLGTIIDNTNTITADCEAFTAFGLSFALADYTEVDITTLSGADRIRGFYQPGVDLPGLDLGLLINGVRYPGVGVSDVNYLGTAIASTTLVTTDIDTITMDFVVEELDTEVSSLYNDLYLGINPEDIIIDGSEYIDTYSSHAPEELVPGAMFDALDLTVSTRPGFDYRRSGHAFETQVIVDAYLVASPTLSFKNLVSHPISIQVVNLSNGKSLTSGINYTTDWVNSTVSILSGAVDTNRIQIIVHEIGGGNQLFRGAFTGDQVDPKLELLVNSAEVFKIVIHANGVELDSGFTSTPSGAITTDSVLVSTDSELTIDTLSTSGQRATIINFTQKYTVDDYIAVTVFGFETPQHSHSYPTTYVSDVFGVDTTTITADHVSEDTVVTIDGKVISADSAVVTSDSNLIKGNTLLVTAGTSTKAINIGSGGNDKTRENLVVNRNGVRLRPPEAVRYISDGDTLDFALPTTGNVVHTTVSANEVIVYVNEIRQTLSTDYIVDSTIPTAKKVTFLTTPPATGTNVDVYINTASDYTVNGEILTLNSAVSGSDMISVTTWKDVSQLDLLTNVFVGPTFTYTTPVIELFDSFGFDTKLFDSSTFAPGTVNLFDLNRTIANSSRMWVTLNGRLLMAGSDYTVSGAGLFLTGNILGLSDVVVVTSMTDNIVPDELSFRMFKDMQGNAAMYKINKDSNSTLLAKDIALSDDVIFVKDVSKLGEPNLELNIFGIVMINGERITYREINTTANTISGLRRGTAGTGAATHIVGSSVNDVGFSSIVPGSIVTAGVLNEDLGSEMNIVPKEFDSVWYAPGTSTPSNGLALQNQTTLQANFVKS